MRERDQITMKVSSGLKIWRKAFLPSPKRTLIQAVILWLEGRGGGGGGENLKGEITTCDQILLFLWNEHSLLNSLSRGIHLQTTQL